MLPAAFMRKLLVGLDNLCLVLLQDVRWELAVQQHAQALLQLLAHEAEGVHLVFELLRCLLPHGRAIDLHRVHEEELQDPCEANTVCTLAALPKRRNAKRKRNVSKRKPKRNQHANPFQNATKTQN